MDDYIVKHWKHAISVSHSEMIANNAEKLVKLAESKVERYGNQWRADIAAGMTAILLKPGEAYQWHFDNLNYADKKISCPRPNRYWTQIIYLTEGKPLEIGDWNPEGERVLETEFSAPEPNKIIARIHPIPGKTVVFPCFLVHRIQPPVQNNRWAVVNFVQEENYKGKTKRDLRNIYYGYFKPK